MFCFYNIVLGSISNKLIKIKIIQYLTKKLKKYLNKSITYKCIVD